MTRSERQQLIDKYTSGAMSPTERRAFRASLAGDPELRTLLRAEEAIASATHAESAALAADVLAPGAHLTSLLAASRMAPVSASTLSLGAKMAVLAAGAGLVVLGAIAYLPVLLSEPASLDVGSRIPVTRTVPLGTEQNATAETSDSITAPEYAAAPPEEARLETRTVTQSWKSPSPKPTIRTQAPAPDPSTEQESISPEQSSAPERPEPPVFENTDVQVEVESK